MSSVPLLKALFQSGIGSRRYLTSLIKERRVNVNNATVEDFRYPVNPEKDIITFDGHVIYITDEPKLYLMLNKPAGIISTISDELGRNTVKDLLPEKFKNKRLFPAGRLDKNSTGLLILTNDGNLTYRITHPKFEHEKEYLVAIEPKLRYQDKQNLELGVKLEDGLTYPSKIRTSNESPYNYSITIHEGRKRQVRRMFIELGYRVYALKRIRIGKLLLGDLRERQIRELSQNEVDRLLNS